jgi:cytochrome c biogenesis factor
MLDGSEFMMGADLIVEHDGNNYTANPNIKFISNKQEIIESVVEPANIKLAVTKIDASGSIDLVVKVLDSELQSIPGEEQPETLTVEASVKPNINLVWLGVILITVGFIIAALRRRKELIRRKS